MLVNGTETNQNLSNISDFSLALKEATDGAWQVSTGMSFHSHGAMIEKALSPYLAVLDFGVKSRDLVQRSIEHMQVDNS